MNPIFEFENSNVNTMMFAFHYFAKSAHFPTQAFFSENSLIFGQNITNSHQ